MAKFATMRTAAGAMPVPTIPRDEQEKEGGLKVIKRRKRSRYSAAERQSGNGKRINSQAEALRDDRPLLGMPIRVLSHKRDKSALSRRRSGTTTRMTDSPRDGRHFPSLYLNPMTQSKASLFLFCGTESLRKTEKERFSHVLLLLCFLGISFAQR